MELGGLLGDGARWALTVVFALAAAEKAETLIHRAAAWHPVMLARGRWRRHATALIGGSFIADVAVAAALVFRPVWGALLGAVLLGVYSLAARGVHGTNGGDDCRCLWKVLKTRTWRGLLVRNLALLSLAGLATVGPRTASLEGMAVGGLLLVGVAVLTRLADHAPSERLRVEARAMRLGSEARSREGAD